MDVARYVSPAGHAVKVCFDNTIFESDEDFENYLITDKSMSKTVVKAYMSKVRSARTLTLKEWNSILKTKGLYKTKKKKV